MTYSRLLGADSNANVLQVGSCGSNSGSGKPLGRNQGSAAQVVPIFIGSANSLRGVGRVGVRLLRCVAMSDEVKPIGEMKPA